MAATTLQDFLVSVKYQIDTASQNTFTSALKRAATSVGGITAEIGLLVTGLLALSEHMARAGEQIYWMSQRLGSSVKGIQEAAFALSNVGVSASEATQGMEQFGEWMRRTGPAANAQLRIMGVTATDTQKAFIQLGQELAKRGGTYEYAHGTEQQRMQYAMTLSWAQAIPGMTEKIMLAAVEAAEFQKVIERINKSLGLGEKELNDYARANVEVVRGFNALNAQWEALKTTFGRIFQPAVAGALKTMFDAFERNMPMIKKLVEGVATAFSILIKFIAQLAVVFGAVLTGFETLGRLAQALVPGLDLARAAIIAFGAALLLSPIGIFLKAMTVLLGLMDDYAAFSEGGISLFDWSSFDAFKDWLTDLTGVDDILVKILGTLGAIAVAVKVVEWGSWLTGLGVPGGKGGKGAPVKGAPGGGRFGWLRAALGLGLAYEATNAIHSGVESGSDVVQDKIFGPGHAQRNKELNEQGAKEFWAGVTRAWQYVTGTPANAAPPAAGTRPGGTTTTPAPSTPLPSGPRPIISSDQLPQMAGNPDIGTRANNPGNLDLSAWEPAVGGVTYMDRTEGRQHTMARFRTMAEGVAASINLLMRNQRSSGNMTIAGAYKGYASNPYFKDLAKSLGFDANTTPFDIQKIGRENPELLAKLIEGKLKREGRSMQSGAVTHQTVMDAIGIAMRPGGFEVPGHEVGGRGGRGATINQTTTVNVAPGPNATETAHRVAGEQRRVNEGLVRNAGSNVR